MKTYRSWVEVDLSAIEHNVKELMTLLSSKEQFMAVVKANAYGHGAIEVCHTLNKIGVYAFATATLFEAIELRKNGIQGQILILGYTEPSLVYLLKKYQLTQTVINSTYAKLVNAQGIDIPVHIAIDSGMHRLGNTQEEFDDIASLFHLPYLHVTGIFSHLCVSDSINIENQDYTRKQIYTFINIVDELKKRYDVGCVHLQSSYGLLNYSYLNFDYVRIGISLYGVYSSKEDYQHPHIHFKPALSLKSKIVLLKSIQKDETVGYGRTYKATQKRKIAVVPIGYGDGLPRCFAHDVLVRGKRVPIVGRICMDQLMIDVSEVDNVSLFDIVTFIGEDHGEKISVEDIAEHVHSISNEILSQLGERLPRIYQGGHYERTL